MHREEGLLTLTDVWDFIYEKEREFIDPTGFMLVWRMFGSEERRYGVLSKAKADFLCKSLNGVGIAAKVILHKVVEK